MSPLPESNDASIRKHESFGKLFEATPVPDSLEGFEVDNKGELSEVWPEGTEKAKEVSHPFVLRADIRSFNDSYIPKLERSNLNSCPPSRTVQLKIRKIPVYKNMPPVGTWLGEIIVLNSVLI
jgi:hypothetical protein